MDRVLVDHGLSGRVVPRVAAVALVVLLAACQSSFRGAPQASLDADRDLLKVAVDRALDKQKIAEALAETQDIGKRNDIVFARMAELDRLYFEYERDLSNELRRSDLVTEIVQLAAGVAGTLTTTATVSRAFSAVNAAVSGTHTAFSQKILVDQTVQALVSTMRANRSTVKVQIYSRLPKAIAEYPLIAAIGDLEAYRQAGTLPAALMGMAQTASAAEQVASKKADVAALSLRVVKLDQTGRDFNLSADAATNRGALAAALGDSGRVDDTRILALANSPPATNAFFAATLSQYNPDNQPFANPDIARYALTQAVFDLDTPAEFEAWRKAIGG